MKKVKNKITTTGTTYNLETLKGSCSSTFIPKNRETQMQRIIRKNEEGKLGKGLIRISYNGFSASSFFETEKQLNKILKNISAKQTIKILKSLTRPSQTIKGLKK